MLFLVEKVTSATVLTNVSFVFLFIMCLCVVVSEAIIDSLNKHIDLTNSDTALFDSIC